MNSNFSFNEETLMSIVELFCDLINILSGSVNFEGSRDHGELVDFFKLVVQNQLTDKI